jgi:anti-sigma factor RsiW
MRGKISDQDLTDYALNELPPEERLYLESMLVVSEECRQDIYEMIELGQLLEESFEERFAMQNECTLTELQRSQLIEFRQPTPVWQRIAAGIVVAAGVAFGVTHPEWLNPQNASTQLAKVTKNASELLASAVAPRKDRAITMPDFQAMAEAPVRWLPTAMDALEPAVVCTPPSWLENTQVSSFKEISN